jgi:hypothetical protein
MLFCKLAGKEANLALGLIYSMLANICAVIASPEEKKKYFIFLRIIYYVAVRRGDWKF